MLSISLVTFAYSIFHLLGKLIQKLQLCLNSANDNKPTWIEIYWLKADINAYCLPIKTKRKSYNAIFLLISHCGKTCNLETPYWKIATFLQ